MIQPRPTKQLRVIDPTLCAQCRFATFPNNYYEASQRTILCSRLDCDNWDTDPKMIRTLDLILEDLFRQA